MLALHVFRTEDVVLEAKELAPELINEEWLEIYKADPKDLEELTISAASSVCPASSW